MRTFSYCLLASSLSLLSKPVAAQQRPAPADTIATEVQLAGADCALFPRDSKLPDDVDYYVTRTGRFTPVQQQGMEAEQALPNVMLEKIYAHPTTGYYAKYPAIIKENLAKYQRQYFGFYNAEHQPCLFINFFYEPNREWTTKPAPYWLRAPIQMADGGPAFWRIYYNLSTHQFYDFSHNGEG